MITAVGPRESLYVRNWYVPGMCFVKKIKCWKTKILNHVFFLSMMCSRHERSRRIVFCFVLVWSENVLSLTAVSFYLMYAVGMSCWTVEHQVACKCKLDLRKYAVGFCVSPYGFHKSVFGCFCRIVGERGGRPLVLTALVDASYISLLLLPRLIARSSD